MLQDFIVSKKDQVVFQTEDSDFSFHNGREFIVEDFIYDFKNEAHKAVSDPISFPLFVLKNETSSISAYADEITPLPSYGKIFCDAISDGLDYIKNNPSCLLAELEKYVSELKNSGSVEDDIYIKGFMVAYYKL